MHVKNMTSKNGEGKAPNQFEITLDDGSTVFQSYETIIAKRDAAGKITLDTHGWDYSVTTGRYRNQFLSENKAATEKKIKSGEYALANLN
jgi:hypothetical protein